MAVKIAYRLQCTAGLGGHASVAVQVAGQCRGPGWGTSMPHRTAASTVDPETGLSVAVQLPLVPRACQQVVWPAPAGAAEVLPICPQSRCCRTTPPLHHMLCMHGALHPTSKGASMCGLAD